MKKDYPAEEKDKKEKGEAELEDFDEALLRSMSPEEKEDPKKDKLDWANEYLGSGELF